MFVDVIFISTLIRFVRTYAKIKVMVINYIAEIHAVADEKLIINELVPNTIC